MQIRGLRSRITTITYYVTLIALSIFASSEFSFAQPNLSVSNTNIEFGVTNVGNFETGPFTITNTGDSTLFFTISISGDTVFFISSGGPYSMQPGMSAVLEIFFNPTSEGAYAATIIISSNDPFTPYFTVNLTGIGNLSHFTGWIKGTVADAENGDPIGGAQIITDIGISTVSFPNGTYLTVHTAGTYTVTASANGYNENSYSDVLIGDAEIVTKDFELITTGAASPGDINIDLEVNLTDAILALQLLARMDISGSIRSDYSTSGADVNRDGKVGLEEIIYILQKVSGLR